MPDERVDLVIDTTASLVAAIDSLAVRGAPALGVAGALGVVVALDEGARNDWNADEVTARRTQGGSRTCPDYSEWGLGGSRCAGKVGMP